jgi:hypothetical protein
VAIEHFSIVLQQGQSFPNQIEEADIRRFYGMTLLDRGALGDRKAAQELLG